MCEPSIAARTAPRHATAPAVGAAGPGTDTAHVWVCVSRTRPLRSLAAGRSGIGRALPRLTRLQVVLLGHDAGGVPVARIGPWWGQSGVPVGAAVGRPASSHSPSEPIPIPRLLMFSRKFVETTQTISQTFRSE